MKVGGWLRQSAPRQRVPKGERRKHTPAWWGAASRRIGATARGLNAARPRIVKSTARLHLRTERSNKSLCASSSISVARRYPSSMRGDRRAARHAGWNLCATDRRVRLRVRPPVAYFPRLLAPLALLPLHASATLPGQCAFVTEVTELAGDALGATTGPPVPSAGLTRAIRVARSALRPGRSLSGRACDVRFWHSSTRLLNCWGAQLMVHVCDALDMPLEAMIIPPMRGCAIKEIGHALRDRRQGLLQQVFLAFRATVVKKSVFHLRALPEQLFEP